MALRYPSLLHPPVGFVRLPGNTHPDEDPLAPVVAAFEGGATGVSGEVHLTSDGVAVLHPGSSLRTGLRHRPLNTLPFDDIPRFIPRLEELYQRGGTDFDLAVSVGNEDAVQRVVGLATAAGGEAVARLWLCSSDWRQAASWRRHAPDSRLVDTSRLRHQGEGPERRAATLAHAGVDAVRLHESDWNAGLCTLFHRFGRLALAGPAAHRRQLDALLRLGVDGVESVHGDRLGEALADHVGAGPA